MDDARAIPNDQPQPAQLRRGGDRRSGDRPTDPLAPLLDWCDRHRRWLGACIALLWIAGYNGQWRLAPDTTLYISLAHAMVRGEALDPAIANQPPGLLWLMATQIRLAGVEHLALLHLVMLGVGLLTLIVMYAWLRVEVGRPAAVLITTIAALTENIARWSYEALTDMPFMLGLMFFMLGAAWLRRAIFAQPDAHTTSTSPHADGLKADSRVMIARGAAAVILGLVLMAVFRSVVIVVMSAAALAVLVHLTRQRRAWAMWAAAAGACIALIVAVIAILTPDAMGGLSHDLSAFFRRLTIDAPVMREQFLHRDLPALLFEAFAEASFGLDLGPVLSLPLTIALIVSGLLVFRDRPLWAILLGLLIAQQLLTGVADRYFLIVMPVLIDAWLRITRSVSRHAPVRWAPSAAVVGVMMWVTPNVIAVGGLIVEQRSTPFYQAYRDGWAEGVVTLCADARAMDIALPAGSVLFIDAPMLAQPRRETATRYICLLLGGRALTPRVWSRHPDHGPPTHVVRVTAPANTPPPPTPPPQRAAPAAQALLENAGLAASDEALVSAVDVRGWTWSIHRIVNSTSVRQPETDRAAQIEPRLLSDG